MHVQKDKRGQLGSHMEKCIFIGYPSDYKGQRPGALLSQNVLSLMKDTFLVSRTGLLSLSIVPTLPLQLLKMSTTLL